MTQAEAKNAPRLEGWAIAAGVGLVAFGAAYVAAGIGSAGSVAIGIVLFLIVGLILGLPGRELPPPVSAAAVPAAPKPPARAEAVVAPAAVISAPVAAPVLPAAAPVAPARPAGLSAARAGKPDDLKQIKGIGPKLEEMLHGLGYFHFDQIASWTAAEIAWVDENLEGFKGRVTRDQWVAQAKILASGGETAFSKRVEDGEVY